MYGLVKIAASPVGDFISAHTNYNDALADRSKQDKFKTESGEASVIMPRPGEIRMDQPTFRKYLAEPEIKEKFDNAVAASDAFMRSNPRSARGLERLENQEKASYIPKAVGAGSLFGGALGGLLGASEGGGKRGLGVGAGIGALAGGSLGGFGANKARDQRRQQIQNRYDLEEALPYIDPDLAVKNQVLRNIYPGNE